MSAKSDGTPKEYYEKLRADGIDAVLLEGGNAEGKKSWAFVGIVNKKIKVPKGDSGLLFMREFLKKHKIKKKKSSPPFTGGFVGFVSYDLGEEWMGLQPKKKSVVPRTHFVFVDHVVAFKTSKKHTQNISHSKQKAPIGVRSNLTKQEYVKKINQIKELILDGETYQVNFSQEFTLPFKKNIFEVYKNVTALNPSPFQFFLETKDFAVCSNSPERLFMLRDRVIQTSPIKGTVPRGKNEAEDKKRIRELLQSKKQAAELAMIVDLERNDLGKICETGSVKVTERRGIEKYSHVIHSVATIQGRLAKTKDWFDALRALFPGGSITGCPKKRTMEIIHNLEDSSRGIYCGSAGYIDLSGDCDFNILIRTIFYDKKKQKVLFRSGGGIVADSKPREEYEETLYKASAFLRVFAKENGL